MEGWKAPQWIIFGIVFVIAATSPVWGFVLLSSHPVRPAHPAVTVPVYSEPVRTVWTSPSPSPSWVRGQ